MFERKNIGTEILNTLSDLKDIGSEIRTLDTLAKTFPTAWHWGQRRNVVVVDKRLAHRNLMKKKKDMLTRRRQLTERLMQLKTQYKGVRHD